MRWEYKTIKLEAKSSFLVGGEFSEGDLDALMNDLGAEGWELVNAFHTTMSPGETKYVVAISKRGV